MQIDPFTVKAYPDLTEIGLSTSNGRLRVCIVTEEITGPVRNGGIASTYYHLAKGLAAQGHDVHVLFLKGPIVQDETPEHWVEHFADFGVTLHYLEQPKRALWGAAVDWQGRFMAAYEWLRDADTFDVVHTSEWRGGLIYALMAKRMGLAFAQTLFLIKTSSPHIWNRHYQMQPIVHRDLLTAAYGEQKCVELADVVIGGSAHLISFMENIGYKIPAKNVFVQPNLVDFSKVTVTDKRPPRAPGDLVKTQELVFFGRLEGRKGIELMCNALDILKDRGVAPSQITFMGKWGAGLATQGGIAVSEYIDLKAQDWMFPVHIIDDKNQPQALSHMCSRDMIAVMPSLIENSTMAVYEALENNIPFIATAVGGTPELIDAGDHGRCLVAPKSQDLADQLERVLREGQVIATSRFSNAENLDVWYGFHAYVSAQINAKGRQAAIAEITAGLDPPAKDVDGISYLLLARRGDDLHAMGGALSALPVGETPDEILLAYTDAALLAPLQMLETQLRAAGLTVRLIDCIGQAAGDALNLLVDAQSYACCVISDGADVTPRAGFFTAAQTALAQRPDCLFSTFFEAPDLLLGLPIGGDVASQVLTSRAYGPEIFGMHRDLRRRLGTFEPYDVRRGILHEYVTRLVESSARDIATKGDLMIFPEVLLDWPKAVAQAKELADDTVYAYLKAKPLIDASSISQRKILLSTLAQNGGGTLPPGALRDRGRRDAETLWLMPADWDRGDISRAQNRALFIGLEEGKNRLWLYAHGKGARVLHIRDMPCATIEVRRYENIGQHQEPLTLSYFDVPDSWEAGTSHSVRWLLEQGETRLRDQFLRITTISKDVRALVSRGPIFTADAVWELLRIKVDQDIERAALLGAQDIGYGTGQYLPPFEPSKQAVVEKSAALIAGQCPKPLRPKPLSQGAEVRGFLIPPDAGYWGLGDWLTGWAWDRTDPDRTLHVALMRDDVPVLMVEANAHMPSLGNRTPGLEQHGFRLPVIASLYAPQAKMQLMIWDSQTPLRNSVLKASLDTRGTPRVVMSAENVAGDLCKG